MPLFNGLRHLHLKVADIDRSARFYERAFGMVRVVAKHDGKMLILASPGLRDQLTLSEGAIGAEIDPREAMVGAPGGVDHFGFLVSPFASFERALAKVTAAGGKLLDRHDLGKFMPSAFLKDPDGYVFQVYKFPPGMGLMVSLAPLIRFLRRTPPRAAMFKEA